MKVTIQQAAANALADFLKPKFPDCDVNSRWVASDKGFPGPNGKAISVVTAAERQDTLLNSIKLLSSSVPVNGQTDAMWQTRVCKQSFQIDIWTTRYVDRDDILARFDEEVCSVGEAGLGDLVFNPDPFGHGLLIPVGYGWEKFGTTADFDFEGPDLMDTADTTGRTTYRAMIRCDGYFGIALKRSHAAKKLTDIQLLIQETGNPVSQSDTK